jgi:hypothetical protein
LDAVYSPHHSFQPHRQKRCGRNTGAGRRGPVTPIARPRDRRDEAVASSGQGGDVSGTVFTVTECLSQARNVKPEAALFHDDVGPNLSDQVSLANYLVWTRNQRNQYVEGTCTHIYRDAVLGEQALVWN